MVTVDLSEVMSAVTERLDRLVQPESPSADAIADAVVTKLAGFFRAAREEAPGIHSPVTAEVVSVHSSTAALPRRDVQRHLRPPAVAPVADRALGAIRQLGAGRPWVDGVADSLDGYRERWARRRPAHFVRPGGPTERQMASLRRQIDVMSTALTLLGARLVDVEGKVDVATQEVHRAVNVLVGQQQIPAGRA
jgi:hypothetical protein